MFANVGLVKTFIAMSVIAEYRIVQFGALDREVTQASAATQKFAGVIGLPKGASAVEGDAVDVIKSGVAEVIYGGNVTVGDVLTADAQGRAVVAVDGNSVIGIAQISGVLGDLGAVQIQFGKHYVKV